MLVIVYHDFLIKQRILQCDELRAQLIEPHSYEKNLQMSDLKRSVGMLCTMVSSLILNFKPTNASIAFQSRNKVAKQLLKGCRKRNAIALLGAIFLCYQCSCFAFA